jgi:hypothetical protein
MSLLLDHWRLLQDCVHSLDASVFRTSKHTFNLDFPPPAFIGDLENAPVVLLDANGGYDPVITPSEFPDRAAVDRYLDMLHHPRAVDPAEVAPYYGKRNYARLIANGSLVLVNAVAYRSPSISREPENRLLAERLPSTSTHRKWLRHELLLQASRGERLVIAHRNALWNLRRKEVGLTNVYFSTNSVSADLSHHALALIADFARHGSRGAGWAQGRSAIAIDKPGATG